MGGFLVRLRPHGVRRCQMSGCAGCKSFSMNLGVVLLAAVALRAPCRRACHLTALAFLVASGAEWCVGITPFLDCILSILRRSIEVLPVVAL